MSDRLCSDCGTAPASRWSYIGYCRRCDEKNGHDNHTMKIDLEKAESVLGKWLLAIVTHKCRVNL